MCYVIFILKGLQSVVFTLLIQHMLIFVCVSVICLPETSGTKCAGLKAAEKEREREREKDTNTLMETDKHTHTQLKTEY